MKTCAFSLRTAGRFAAAVFSCGLPAMVVALARPLPCAAQDLRRGGSLLTDRDAYVSPPAELIAGPVVQQSTVSPMARNVAVLRMSMRIGPENLPSANNPHPSPPRAEQEIVFWNAGVRRPISLWHGGGIETRVTLSEWMPTTESLFAVVDKMILPDPAQQGVQPQHEFRLLLLGNGIERAVAVPTPEIGADAMTVDVSPTKPIAVLRLDSYQPVVQSTLVLLHPNGRVGARISAPAGTQSFVVWDADGNPVVNAGTADTPHARVNYAVDTRTGQLTLLKAPLKPYVAPSAPRPALPFQIVTKRQDIKLAETVQRTMPIWLESIAKSESPRMLLTADGENARLLPDGSGAIYTAQGALWFSQLMKVDKASYLTVTAAARRQVLISNAKQLGLAAIMCAQDNDEVLPSADGIQDKLFPYLKVDSLFENFTYTFAGGKMADIESPAETELGYVAGGDGRAVIYADGHVKWAKK